MCMGKDSVRSKKYDFAYVWLAFEAGQSIRLVGGIGAKLIVDAEVGE